MQTTCPDLLCDINTARSQIIDYKITRPTHHQAILWVMVTPYSWFGTYANNPRQYNKITYQHTFKNATTGLKFTNRTDDETNYEVEVEDE